MEDVLISHIDHASSVTHSSAVHSDRQDYFAYNL